MKKFNVDEQTQLAEPIEIILEGKVYTLGKITVELMDRVVALGKDKDNLDTPVKQLALLLGTEIKEIRDIDIRKIGKTLEYITNTIKEGIEAKNP
ncbi:hypothetical protein FJZ33_00170 [Candidatus Poribacteria bacterium]|nr:hypothetical protein [Candidatus Poribacteria bacterium]